MHIIGKFCVREILDEVVAIPTGNGPMEFSGIVSLNPVGRFLFELLAEERTKNELVAAVVAEYDVDEATAVSDVNDFLGALREQKLLAE